MTKEARDCFFAGYQAFEAGEFSDAVALATRCLNITSSDSYWYAGALGLGCGVDNCLRDDGGVQRDATALLDRGKRPEKECFFWLSSC